MADKFEDYADSLESPYTNGEAVTPDDATDITYVSRGILVGTAGDVRGTMEGGATLTIPNLAAGVVHPLRVTRVHATGTAATGVHAFW